MHVPATTTSHEVRRMQLWSLREDVHVESDAASDSLVLHTRWGDTRVWRPGDTVREALRRMSLGPISLDNVVDGPAGRAGRATAPLQEATVRGVELARLRTLLDHVSYAVVRSLALEDAQQPLMSCVPLAADASFRPVPLAEHRPVRLSRFASLRSDGDTLVLESPLSLYRVVFPRPEAVWVVGALGARTTPKAVAAVLPLSAAVTTEILSHLAAAGMLAVGDEVLADVGQRFGEDTDPALATWSHHDLLFHSRSRLGRHDGDFGATYPHVGRLAPEPAIKTPPEGRRLALQRPDLARTAAREPSLTTVLESRRSVRSYGDRPMTAAQLGELLFRVARVRSTGTADGGSPVAHEISDRPFPSGGAAYELEFYVTVGECEGVERGVHYYDPEGHGLVLVSDDERHVAEMLSGARIGADTSRPPPVLITMTARFRRLSWKYSGLGYALTLKHVGIVQQTLYLVATAMGLAPCALGSGDSELVARVCGLDWRVEPSVGEFIVGPAPELVSAAAPAEKAFSTDVPHSPPAAVTITKAP